MRSRARVEARLFCFWRPRNVRRAEFEVRRAKARRQNPGGKSRSLSFRTSHLERRTPHARLIKVLIQGAHAEQDEHLGKSRDFLQGAQEMPRCSSCLSTLDEKTCGVRRQEDKIPVASQKVFRPVPRTSNAAPRTPEPHAREGLIWLRTGGRRSGWCRSR